jgi:hypothetical protein
MAKPKSIIEKFSETVKGLADSASQALKSEEPARVDETSAAYMPFSAEGLVSDPLLVPPVASQPAPRKRRAASKTARRGAAKTAKRSSARPSPAKKSAAKTSAAKTSARKAAKKSASVRSKGITKTAKRGGVRKSARKRRQ